jgi:hypothetical protein
MQCLQKSDTIWRHFFMEEKVNPSTELSKDQVQI